MEAKQSQIEDDVRVALEYVRHASKIDPIYLSVTDMSKYYLYLALGRKAQKLTYFSDPIPEVCFTHISWGRLQPQVTTSHSTRMFTTTHHRTMRNHHTSPEDELGQG